MITESDEIIALEEQAAKAQKALILAKSKQAKLRKKLREEKEAKKFANGKNVLAQTAAKCRTNLEFLNTFLNLEKIDSAFWEVLPDGEYGNWQPIYEFLTNNFGGDMKKPCGIFKYVFMGDWIDYFKNVDAQICLWMENLPSDSYWDEITYRLIRMDGELYCSYSTYCETNDDGYTSEKWQLAEIEQEQITVNHVIAKDGKGKRIDLSRSI